MPKMNNDHVNLYSEETNAESSMGLLMRIYRIVPHIHSALFPTLYMAKRSAIELLLRKQESCFPNAYKHVPESVEIFELNLRAYSRWLSTTYIIRYALVSAFAKAIVLEDNNRHHQK